MRSKWSLLCIVTVVLALAAGSWAFAGSETKASEHPTAGTQAKPAEHPTAGAQAKTSEQAAAGILDGKSFTGEMMQAGKKTGEKDEFVFAEGKFRSTGCDQYGFTAVSYTATTKAGVTTFTSEATSETDGKMAWKGTVKGDTIEGTAVWTKEGQTPTQYHFKGMLKK